MADIKLSKFRILGIAWNTYRKLSTWWKETSVDGKIEMKEISNLWYVFAAIYEDITDKKISITIPHIKELKPSKDGGMRKNIQIKEEEVTDVKIPSEYFEEK